MVIDYKKDQLVCFVDGIGHTAVATFVEDIGNDMIRLKNPLWLSLVPQQTPDGKQTTVLQTPSWVFRDFLADHNEDQIWDVSVKNYTWLKNCILADIVKLHYYNSFSRIENGKTIPVDKDNNPTTPPNQGQVSVDDVAKA